MYLLIDKREYLDEFDWVEEYTLYKEYDEIELVFVIDNSSSMLISDPNNSRESIAVSIANAFPNNTDTSAYVLANNSIISLSDQDGTIIWQSQNTQYALPVITYQTGGDLNSIFRGILCSYDNFDSDTANHKILRHIVVLTDGNSIDHTLDNQFGDPNLQYDIYNEIASCQSTKECQISIIDFSQSGTDTMSATADLSAVIPVHYYLNCNYQLFMNDYYKILDLGTDTDNDGIPDDYEDNITLFNGKTISTDYELADTDGDGMKDGEEVRLEVKYSSDGNYAAVVGHLVSDPTDEDGDFDGIPDNKDTAPLNKGLAGGIVGKLTVVSSGISTSHAGNWGSFDAGSVTVLAGTGHSFLIYKSYINDELDLYNFYKIIPLSQENIVNINVLEKTNYKIYSNNNITIGAFSKDNDLSNGGICCNVEISNYQSNNSDAQFGNKAVSTNITAIQLEELLRYWNNNNYYNVLTHNCAIVALTSWNCVSNDRLSYTPFPYLLKEEIKQKSDSYTISMADVLSNVGEMV